MRLQDDIDFTTLTWVKAELDETLKQARHALEAYVEEPTDASQMRFCATYLHQVQGTLRMVELYGAAMVTEEMEHLASALLENDIKDRDEAYAVLMRGIVQLPDYLERLQTGHKDIPIVLLPLLNDLRGARGEKGLSEIVLFTPDLTRPLPASAKGPAVALSEQEMRPIAGQLRGQFQLALLNWFRSVESDTNIARIAQVCDKLVAIVAQEEARRLFWVAAGVLDALRSKAFEPSPQLKQTIGKVEREIKRLADAGEGSFRVDPPRELTRNLLYFVAHAPTEHGRIGELRQVFRLDALLPTEAEIAHARGSISGHNRALLDTVSIAIKEDLLRVKDALDIHLRTNNAQPADLSAQVEVLDRVSDTLGMLGLGVARRVVQEQRTAIHQVATGHRPSDEATLLDIAGALLYVEASLDDQVQHLGGGATEADALERPLPQAEARRVLDALIKEAQANFAQAKQCYVAFVESNWDHAQLQDVPRLLEEVSGAMRILDLVEPPQYLLAVRRFTESELLGRRRVPNGQQMDTLADALASLEYFLEAVREHRAGREKILEVTRTSLESLGYWPIPEDLHVPAVTAERPAFVDPPVAQAPAPAPEPLDLTASFVAALESAAPDAAAPAASPLSLPEVPAAPTRPAVESAPPVAAIPAASPPSGPATTPAPVPAPTPAAPATVRPVAAPVGELLVGFESASDEIDEEIREVFVEEVQEEISNLEDLLPLWKVAPDNMEHLKPIRRVFHTLKGSGRLVGALSLGEFSWKIENMLNRVLDNSIQPTAPVQSIIDHAFRVLPDLLAALRGTTGARADLTGIKAVADRLAAGEQAWYVAPTAPTEEPEIAPLQTPIAVAIEAPREEVPVALEALPVEIEQALEESTTAELETALEDQPEPAGEPLVSIDPVLFDILRAEVAGHLETMDEYLAASAGVARPATDALLRAVHTMNGAFAMTDVPLITEVVGPLEGYIKRLLAHGGTPAPSGMRVIRDSTAAVRTLMVELDSSHPRLPDFDDLIRRVCAERDALPEPVGPSVPLHLDIEESLELSEAVSMSSSDFSTTASEAAAAATQVPLGDFVDRAEDSFATFATEGDDDLSLFESADLLDDIATIESTEASNEADAVAELGELPTTEAWADDLALPETIEMVAVELPDFEPATPQATFEPAAPEAAIPAATPTVELPDDLSSLDAELLALEDDVAPASDAAPEFEILEAELLDDDEPPANVVEPLATTVPGESLASTWTDVLPASPSEAMDAARAAEPTPVETDFALEAMIAAYDASPDSSAFDAARAEEATDVLPVSAEPERVASDPVSTAPTDSLSVESLDDFDFDLGSLDAPEVTEVEELTSLDGLTAAELSSLGLAPIDVSEEQQSALANAALEAELAASEEKESEARRAADAAELADLERQMEALEAEEAAARLAAEETFAVGAADDVPALEAEPLLPVEPLADFAAEEAAWQDEAPRAPAAPAAAVAALPSVDPALLAAFTAGLSDADPDPDAALDIADMDEELLDIFLEEGGDILDHSDGLMARLRESPADRELVVGLQRDLHTLKGGARMAGLPPIGDLGHAMESLLEAVAEGRRDLSRIGVETLERAFDRLHGMVTRVGERRALAMPVTLIDRVEALVRGDELVVAAAAAPLADAGVAIETPVAEPVAEEAKALRPLTVPSPLSEPMVDEDEISVRAPQEQIRIRADLLDRLVNYAGEVAIYRARLEQQLGLFRGNLGELDQTTTRLREQLRKLEIETEAQIVARYQREAEVGDSSFDPLELDRFSTLQQLSRALSESAADISNLQSSLEDHTRQYETLLLQQSRVSSELQEGLMRTRMVPFDALVPRLRRIIRQTAGELGKKAQLKVEGAQGEMDRNVLDRMTAPLEHMLRNALAHGLETPAERVAAGKSDEGTVKISVQREGSEVVITVSDDGRGLDRDAIRRKALERGLMKPDAQLSDRDLYGFILETGFSTATTVSKIAGRGVGMDVVHSEIRQLGGSLYIESERGKGSEFVVRLPFTLAVTQAVFVKHGDTMFSVPISSVQGVARIDRGALEAQLASGEPTFRYAGEDYSIYDLGLLLGQSHVRAEDSLQVPLLLARSGDQRAAICVDQVIGSREIVVKPVGPQVSSIPGIFGATIMGDGRVIVILDVAPLVRRSAALRKSGAAPIIAVPVEQRRIPLVMVVDDSITMRKVTGRVLERHNYEVITAKDGVDAIEKLQDRIPDVMLLDIEMPRMDGYELATHMRNDVRLRGVPIIMITSRTGEKHRQRAFEIGVDRYLGKPYQETDLMRNVQEILKVGRGGVGE